MTSLRPLHRNLEQELLSLLRGASLECPVCGEFVLHRGPEIACNECGMRVGPRGVAEGDADLLPRDGGFAAVACSRGWGSRRAGYN
jgi:uncharacterized protein (DUF983 family)